MKKKKIAITIIYILISLISSSNANAIEVSTSAESAILMDAGSGRILYSYDAHKKLPMASTTKIMTALVALDKGNLDDIVKIKKESVGVEGSSIYLYEGEEISLRDLLYGLMLRSGNDSAVAIASYIGESEKDFISLMNNKAKKIGANDTNFVNPNGLENVNHYTTAYDLALITREALKNEEFKKIVSTKLWTANREKNNYFANKNKTLWQYNGADGVKTGYTIRAGRCLVSSATRNQMQLIAIVLNDSNWFNDCYNLLNYGFDNYIPCLILDEGQFIRNIKVVNGKKEFLPVINKNTFIIPLREDEKDKIKVNLGLPEQVAAPISKGDDLGEISVHLNGELIYNGKLIAKEDIVSINLIEKLLKGLKN